MKLTAKILIPIMLLLSMALPAGAYNVVDLPETVSFDDAFGIFSASEITRATISNYSDRKYVELTREQIEELYTNMASMQLKRQINPMPFRGTALNLYTEDGSAKSYYVSSGIEIGTYGSSNYITYVAEGEDAVYMTNIETIYRDSEEKLSGDVLYRSTLNDFLKMPSQAWGYTSVREAAAKNLLPYEFTSKYDDNITREEFCKLLANLVCAVGNYVSLEDYAQDNDITYDASYFTDCDGRDSSINVLHAMGIVSGREENNFDPDGSVTREEAAAMLCRAAEKFMYIKTENELSFTDTYYISDWAKIFVAWVSEQGIMNGTDNMFLPKENYTVLQAIATMSREYNVIEEHINF